MAIQGTIKFVNPAKFSDKTQKWSQSIKVAVPGQPDAVIYGASGSFDTYQPNTQVMIEQEGQYWRLAKDQSGVSVTGSAAPSQNAPAPQHQAPPVQDPATLLRRAQEYTTLYLQIARQVREDATFAMEPGQVIASAAATIFIQLRP